MTRPTTTDPATGTWCAEWELSRADEAPVSGTLPRPDHARSRVLVRLHGQPLGYVNSASAPADLDPSELVAAAGQRWATAIAAHLAAEDLTADGTSVPSATPQCPTADPTETPLVTVIVCTRDRADDLVGCLDRLRALRHPTLDILIVDNAPSDDRTALLVAEYTARDERFRTVQEPTPGLSAARNCGVRHARGEYIAFTDDDVAVDPGWIAGLLRGFGRDEKVGAVTGLVATADISGPAEAYFDARSPSWSARMEPELYDLDLHRRDEPLYPYSAGIFGTGANLAFRRQALVAAGAFDEALGAGAPTKGGEDLDMFVRILRSGWAIAHEPSAVVWHHHRADETALLKQMYGYGSGLTAYLTKCLLERGSRGQVLRRLPAGAVRMVGIKRSTDERLVAGVPAPRGAMRRELSGMAAGPWLYLRARRSLRRGHRP